jgi:3-hydroxymyristoyl/3-hydroxydecanoyl-(acyl carrier protein) dehydratase
MVFDREFSGFDGHFPGDPTLPGIGQLSMVSDVIGRLAGPGYVLTGLGRVKFRRRVQPGERLQIHAVAGNNKKTYSFRMTVGDDELVSSGVMRFSPLKERE